jgi:hypothetical protein
MANIFKRAALAIRSLTGLKREPELDPQLSFIQPFTDSSDDAGQSAPELPPALDASGNPWEDALITSDTLARQDTDAAIEAAIATGQFDDSTSQSFDAAAITPAATEVMATQDSEAAIATSQLDETPIQIIEPAPDQPIELQPVLAVAQVATPTIAAEAPAPAPVEAPIELKPEPASKPNVSFTELYELISGEVNKRTDNAINIYERMLAATRQELDATRKNNRIAWTIGGVMTAVATFGAVWAAGEVSASRVELGSLKQQVMAGQQASAERDQLRNDLIRTREASAKIEIDMLKSRLDQAISLSADRDRMKEELQSVRHAKQEAELELRLARAAAATQPVSQARPTAIEKPAARQASADAAAVAGSERPDVWSILLDGKNGH